MATFQESSRQTWTSANTVEHINAGSLQRIADAVEKMSGSYGQIINDRNFYQKLYEDECKRMAKLRSQIRGLRGAITKLKG